jgi:hypothetical protein
MNTSEFPGQTLQPLPANPGPVGDDEFSLLQKITQLLYNLSQSGSSGAWTSGPGAPSNSAGNVGDFYIDNATQIVYEKTGALTWTTRGQLVPV